MAMTWQTARTILRDRLKTIKGMDPARKAQPVGIGWLQNMAEAIETLLPTLSQPEGMCGHTVEGAFALRTCGLPFGHKGKHFYREGPVFAAPKKPRPKAEEE